jgi:hypothetical protein
MTHDELVMAAVALSFATLVTAHVAIVAGLARRPPRWRAAVAAVVAPLAPFWAARSGMHVRAVVWLMSAVVYGVALWVASR